VPNALTIVNVRGFELRLETRPGVFASHGLDAGSELLIEAMHVAPTARVLDLGCGGGAIGIVAAKLATKGSAVLIDSDIRATRLAQRNLELNGVTNAAVVLGDGVHDLPPKSRFEVVVSNPPTHQGREVLLDLVEGAYGVLRPRGSLYMVFNRLPSLSRDIESVFGNGEVVARSKGYVVVRAVKTPRAQEAGDDDWSVVPANRRATGQTGSRGGRGR
jgi:16S rRNA (guanine1207-N2)-methyltransferase